MIQTLQPVYFATSQSGSQSNPTVDSGLTEEQRGGPRADEPWRPVEQAELYHIQYLASAQWENFWTGNEKRLKEDLANGMYFFYLLLQFQNSEKNITAQGYVLTCLL